MPRTITYEIIDRPDGRFAVVARMEPGRIYRRDDLTTLGEAEAWVEGLRVLMAACGAPVVQADSRASSTPTIVPPERCASASDDRPSLGIPPRHGDRDAG